MSETPDWHALVRSRLQSPRREIVEELAQHLADLYEEALASGSSHEGALAIAQAALPQEARALARELSALAAPPVERLAERLHAEAHEPSRRSERFPMLDDLRRDLLYAVRTLLRAPAFTAVAVATLALGIGANTAIFSLVNATLLARLPVRSPEDLVYVFRGAAGNFSGVFAYPEYVELRDGNSVLDGLAVWGGITASMNADAETDLVGGAIVSGNFFELLGVTAERGRALRASDDVTPGAHPVAVISHGLWQRRFGGRSDIVGHTILLNGARFTVVGVMPREFPGAQVGAVRDLYVPMMMQALIRPPRGGYSGEMNPDLLETRGNRWLFAVGRLRPGVTRGAAQAALTLVAQQHEPPPPPGRASRPLEIRATPVNDGMPTQRERMAPVAKLLGAIVSCVLLIACANVANLLLSRASARRREIAVRLAIGASRARLLRQLLTESVLIALLGGAAGVGLAFWLVGALRASPPPAGGLPITLDFAIDLRVLLFTLLLSVATGIAFGLLPALRASQPTLVPALKDESFIPDERARRFDLRKALVVAQVALSLVLLIASSLFVRSLREAQAIHPGFDVERLVTLPLNVNLLRYTRAQGRAFYAQAVERAQSLPGIESASVARVAVLTGGGSIRGLAVEGRELADSEGRSDGTGMAASDPSTVNVNMIGLSYFRTLGIPLRRGRDFGAEDREASPAVAVVNEAFARLHFPHDEVLGKRLSFGGRQGPWREIVGVVADSKYLTLGEAPAAIVYLPLAQNHETGVTLYARTTGDPTAVAAALRREIQALEPNLPLGNPTPVRETLRASLYVARMGAILIAAFGALALALACVGLYGVMAFSMARRTRELGIRMALGAERAQVFSLVIREGLALVGCGLLLGLALAAASARFVERFLYGVRPVDPLTFAVTPVVLLGVALLACVVPARRATAVDPMLALRVS
jgi:predicted permease